MPTNAQSIARAVKDAGCGQLFTLMGDGNMHLILALNAADIGIVEVRHESAAVAMAEGYGWSSGRVGICSVTHGPGLSHTATSLLVSSRNRSPLVVLAGETPTGYAGAQRFDQRRLVEACEATYRAVTAGDDAGSVVAAAIAEAAKSRRPVVVGIPADLFDLPAVGADHPEPARFQPAGGDEPDQAADLRAVDALIEEVTRAERPILLAGRGVAASGSAGLVRELAELLGAALSTTLPVKGLFEGHPLDIGIAGGLSHPDAEPVFDQADLVLAIGASAGASTTRSGQLFPAARLVRLDTDEIDAGRRGIQVRGEAHATLTGVLERLRSSGARRPAWFERSRPWPECWRTELDDYQPELAPGTVDPRQAVLDLDPVLPEDAVIVVANGHCSGFASALLRAGAPRGFHLAQGFGSIGQGLTTAIGVALGAPDRPTVVFEGDAAFMMHAQELDTAVRAGARLTVIVLNDEALGTEYHRLSDAQDGGGLALVPAPGITDVARALGAFAIQVTRGGDVAEAVAEALRARTSVVELRTSRSVESRHLRWRQLAAPRVAAEGAGHVR